MIAALFALAAAMVIGGAAAVVQGFPYVRMESGLALVIAGSVAASSGAVLLGLGVVALGLRRVERAAREAVHGAVPGAASAFSGLVQGAFPADAAPAAAHGAFQDVLRAPAAVEPSADGRPRLPPILPPIPPLDLPPAPAFVVPAAASLAPAVEPPASGERMRFEPRVDSGPAAAPEPELPMPGLDPPEPVREPVHEPAASAALDPTPGPGALHPGAGDDLFAAPEPPLRSDGFGVAEPEGRPAGTPESSPPEPDPAEHALRPSLDAAPERAVVGRYSSGANTYVMFEDGSIEADTPQGRFTFTSLEELKAFVEGGEPGARGAA